MERIFSKTPAPAPAPVQASNNPVKNEPPQTHQTPGMAPNGVVPAGGGDQSPLEQFTKLWETTPVDPNAPAEPAQITPEKIMEAAGKVDFSKVLSQTDLQAVGAGGDGAIQALAGILNKTMQTSYGHSAVAATKIVEQAVAQAEQRFAAKLPTLINSQSSKSELVSGNKALSDPAVAPLVEMVHRQFVEKFPNASPSDITALTQNYMKTVAGVFNPQTASPDQQAADKKKAADDDWSGYTG
jgi:hypothetical protein